MKNIKQILLSTAIILPFSALAHGEEILGAFYLEILVFIAILIFLGFLKWKPIGKCLLFLIYVFTLYLVVLCINGLNYLDNKTLINVSLTVVPIFTVLISQRLLRAYFKKLD